MLYTGVASSSVEVDEMRVRGHTRGVDQEQHAPALGRERMRMPSVRSLGGQGGRAGDRGSQLNDPLLAVGLVGHRHRPHHYHLGNRCGVGGFDVEFPAVMHQVRRGGDRRAVRRGPVGGEQVGRAEDLDRPVRRALVARRQDAGIR